MAASYTFLPWVRQGVVSAIQAKDTAGAQLSSRVQINLMARLKDDPNPDTQIAVRVYGPGDVTGFDARQVIHTEPQHLTSDFEPNYFPFVEFDRPDFPWIFTPATANDNEQLRPWICLVVVEKREANLKVDLTRPLPVLQANAETELPDLSEAWAWAHAQVSGSPTTDKGLDDVLANSSERTLSRLLSPRKLEPNRSYYACVVPTFEIGRKAGLGEEVKDSLGEADEFLKPAWDGNTGEIDLPVYYHWEFATGAAGDFESLVWLLQRKQLTSQEVGTREVQVNNPDLDNPWPEVEGFEKILLEGALRAYQSQTQNRDDPLKPLQDSEDYKKFQEKLRALLNKPEDPKSIVTLPPGIPIAPPIYGRWHAAQKTIPEKTISNGARDVAWLRELNLNPSHRAVASIGTQIVQDQQEQLMASAWEQVGEIEKANQILRQAQLALAAAATIYEQHLAVLAEETFFVMTSQVHSRTLIDPQLVLNPAPTGMVNAKTTFAITGTSRVPQALAEGTFRRLTRSRGPLARRLKTYGGLRSGRLLQRLNDGAIQVVPKRLPPHGMVTMEQVLRRFERLDRFCAEQVRHRLDTEFEVIRSTLPPPENISNDLNPILTQLNQLLTSENLSLDARKHLERAQRALMKSQGLLRRLPPPLSLDALQGLMHLFSAARDVLTEAMRSLAGSGFFDSVDQIRIALDSIFPPQKIQRLLFGIAVYAHQREMEPCDSPVPQPKPKLNLLAIKTALLEQLNPEKTIKARIKSQIVPPSYWNLDTRFEAIMAAPEFPSPMYRPLAEFSQDLMLPGLEHVPPNIITLLETNPRFIEAYMVGLNHEMSRELLWREFPTDQRGTYFRQFWDARGQVPPPATPTKDIEPITNTEVWKDSHRLGENMKNGGEQGQTVMLIRGDLLRRYPRAIIYAARAEWSKDENNKNIEPRTPVKPVGTPSDKDFPEKYPSFQGTLSPDITFIGFDLPLDEAKGSQIPNDDRPGWFFILQQQPTEPRYGLDANEATSDRSIWTWRDLSWVHVKLTVSGNETSPDEGYIKLEDGPKNTFPSVTNPAGLKWDKDAHSAQIAAITLQQPFRVAIHASDLLPAEK